MDNKAIFLDRDGTIIIDKHYLHDTHEIEYFDDTFNALKTMQKLGYKLFMVTNQSGIGRGYFTVDQMHEVHKKMLFDFEEEGIHFDDIAFCPHAPDDGCDCRKPHPKMLNDLCQKHNINPKASYMIGDKLIDAICGKNAGMQGCTIGNKAQSEKFPRFNNLTEFSQYLMKN